MNEFASNIDFPEPSLIHTLIFDFDGIFTNNKVVIDQDGRESVICDRADGLALDFIRYYKAVGLFNAQYFILSKEANPVVLARSKKMQIECKFGINDKLTFVKNYLLTHHGGLNNPFDGLVYLGNDLNDLQIMRLAGVSVAPSDAHPLVLKSAKIVMPQKGGDKFVRAFIENFFKINELNEELLDELISNC